MWHGGGKGGGVERMNVGTLARTFLEILALELTTVIWMLILGLLSGQIQSFLVAIFCFVIVTFPILLYLHLATYQQTKRKEK